MPKANLSGPSSVPVVKGSAPLADDHRPFDTINDQARLDAIEARGPQPQKTITVHKVTYYKGRLYAKGDTVTIDAADEPMFGVSSATYGHDEATRPFNQGERSVKTIRELTVTNNLNTVQYNPAPAAG